MADWTLTIDTLTWLNATGVAVAETDPTATQKELTFTIRDASGTARPQETRRFPKTMTNEAVANSLTHVMHMEKYPAPVAPAMVVGGQITLTASGGPVVSSKNPVGFRQALLGALSGASQAEKFQRAKTLRQKFPGFTEPFLRALDGPDLSAEEEVWVKALWADMLAQIGKPGEILTRAEVDGISALAPQYNVPLI